MENLSAYSDRELLSFCGQFSNACGLSYIGNDDPLGSPEKTVTINDDWTVSQDEPVPEIRYDSENDAEEDDERSSEETERNEDDLTVENVRNKEDDDDSDTISFDKRIDYRSFLRNNTPRESEDQVVPFEPLPVPTSQSMDKKNKRSLDENEDKIRKNIVGKKMAVTVASRIKEIEKRSSGKLTSLPCKTKEEIENRNTPKPP